RAAGRPVLVQAGDLPEWLRCEPEGLRLALKVLVENAIQYGAPDELIELHGRRADGGIELVVRDHGAGVAGGDTELIFGKGYRGRNSAGRPGSGLGLYMARSVVEVHGGSLTVRNMEQGGASFRLWLPAHNGLGRPLAPQGSAVDHSGSQKQRLGDEQQSHQLKEHKTNKVVNP
ncbi:MAG: sensor histidine kinase, partial [Telluria sp.]